MGPTTNSSAGQRHAPDRHARVGTVQATWQAPVGCQGAAADRLRHARENWAGHVCSTVGAEAPTTDCACARAGTNPGGERGVSWLGMWLGHGSRSARARARVRASRRIGQVSCRGRPNTRQWSGFLCSILVQAGFSPALHQFCWFPVVLGANRHREVGFPSKYRQNLGNIPRRISISSRNLTTIKGSLHPHSR